MKIFLKSFVVMLILGISTTASGQVDILAGLGLSYGTAPKAVGLHIKGDVDFTEPWGASMKFTTYFKSDFNYWELNFDGHYFFDMSEELMLYPLAGLNISHYGVNVGVPGLFGIGSVGGTKVGLNLGGGARYNVANQIWLFGEIKYIVSNFDGLVISAGGLYHF